MKRWLSFKDGCHVLLKNKTEAGTFYVPERGIDDHHGTPHGEFIPEHVHYNYLNTDVYDKNLKSQGKKPANKGEFLPKG